MSMTKKKTTTAKTTTRGRKSTPAKKKKTMFINVEDFKDAFDIESISVLENPNTGKKFCSLGDNLNMKCQGDLDHTAPMAILWQRDDEDYTIDGLEENLDFLCLINVDESKMVEPIIVL